MDNKLYRINDVILKHLAAEKSKLEAELERILNKDMEIGMVITHIDDLLTRIANNNQKTIHWGAYIVTPESENKEQNG